MPDPDYKRLWLQACKAYDTKNPSGCVCNIDPDTDDLRSPCGLHKGWLEAAVYAERERCKRIAVHYAVMASQMGSKEKERTAASIAQEIDGA